MNETLFEEIVGQESAKARLDFYLKSYYHTRILPNLMFVAPKGNGKTTLARKLAQGLVKFDENGQTVPNELGRPTRKPFIEINCSGLKNLRQFLNGIILPHMNDKDATILFDEASELPKDITMALLTILNPNPENRTSFSFDDYTFDFDFRRHSFLFATSEPQKVFHALLDRLKRVDLEEYNHNHLAAILQKGAKGVDFEDCVLLDMATTMRGNARAAQMLANDVKLYLRGSEIFMREDWLKMRNVLGILPLGLSQTELTILRYLAARPTEGTSLTCLSAKTGMTKDSLQKDIELFLMKHNLLEITTEGRKITPQGVDYLKNLEAWVTAV
jgi:Holliday junction resolvasome RuvABC ATP-dependent DNA helicase subunit